MVENDTNEKEELTQEVSHIYVDSVKHLEEGQIVKGKIVSITPQHVIVDINYKSEGAIPIGEFRAAENLKVGDEIDVLLESKEDESGMVVLSKEKVERALGWDRIIKSFKEGDLIEGAVINKVKGGFMVDVGVEAFLPASQAVLKQTGKGD